MIGLAVLAEIAELVEFGVIAGADDAGFGGDGGRLVGEGFFEAFADIGELVDFLEEDADEVAATGLRRGEEFLQDGELREGFAEGEEFAGSGEAKSDAAGEALEVLDAAQLFADFAADDGLLEEMFDGFEAGGDGVWINERAEHPGTQEARTHAGDGGIESGDERGGAGRLGFLGEDGGEEFEVADGDGIEDEGVVLLVVADAIEMAEGFDAGGIVTFAAGGIFAEVVNDGAGGGLRLRVVVEAKAG